LANQGKTLVKKGYSFKISIDEEIAPGSGKTEQPDFIYLLHPEKLPGDSKAKHFLHLVMGLMKVSKEKRKEIMSLKDLAPVINKPIKELDKIELGHLYLCLADMKAFSIYLLNNCTNGMTGDFAVQLKDILERQADNGAVILVLFSGEIHLLLPEQAMLIAKESDKKRWSKYIDAYRTEMNEEDE
jgi:ABC-type multidrug transport system ATPase subunit